jgi:hypothetical protein
LEVNALTPQFVATRKAWEGDYEGNAVQLFLHPLSHWNENRMTLAGSDTTEGAYCNLVSIIQSSGTGKSRLVHETAGFVFTIPINLRHPLESEYF